MPRELLIAGINDAAFAAHLNPPLATMRLPAYDIGMRAAATLLNRVGDRPVASQTEVQVSLILRGSTAPPFQLLHQDRLEQQTS